MYRIDDRVLIGVLVVALVLGLAIGFVAAGAV